MHRPCGPELRPLPRPTTARANTKRFCNSTWAICSSIQLAFTWRVRSKPHAHGHADGTWDGQHLPYNGGRPSGPEAVHLNGNAWGTDEGVPADCGCPMALAGSTAHSWCPRPIRPWRCTVFRLAQRALRLALWIVRLAIVVEKGTVWDAASGTCVSDGTSAPTCVEDSMVTEQWPCQTSSSCLSALGWCVPSNAASLALTPWNNPFQTASRRRGDRRRTHPITVQIGSARILQTR